MPDFIPPTLSPPNSPDLNPVDYKVWAVMQERVYKTNIVNVDELCDRIVNVYVWLTQQFDSGMYVFFSVRVINRCNSLEEEVVLSIKNQLQRVCKARIGFFIDWRVLPLWSHSDLPPCDCTWWVTLLVMCNTQTTILRRLSNTQLWLKSWEVAC